VVRDVCRQLTVGPITAAVGVSFGGLQAVHVATDRALAVPRLILHTAGLGTAYRTIERMRPKPPEPERPFAYLAAPEVRRCSSRPPLSDLVPTCSASGSRPATHAGLTGT
jgi:pimeloyl-ACP methyl ester carboxylesterase